MVLVNPLNIVVVALNGFINYDFRNARSDKNLINAGKLKIFHNFVYFWHV